MLRSKTLTTLLFLFGLLPFLIFETGQSAAIIRRITQTPEETISLNPSISGDGRQIEHNIDRRAVVGDRIDVEVAERVRRRELRGAAHCQASRRLRVPAVASGDERGGGLGRGVGQFGQHVAVELGGEGGAGGSE